MFYWTGIGTRDTPPAQHRVATWVGFHTTKIGGVLRSGGAKGSDIAFQQGVELFCDRNQLSPGWRQQIYLPQPSFNGLFAYPAYGYIDSLALPAWEEAEAIAATLHPAWHRCHGFARRAHVRNVFQILGHELNTPSEFLVFYKEPTASGQITGGTATAYNLAMRYGIPCYNLFHPETVHRLMSEVGI